jgi:hypothetical protein
MRRHRRVPDAKWGETAREEIAESWLTRQAIDARLMVDQEAKWENAT